MHNIEHPLFSIGLTAASKVVGAFTISVYAAQEEAIARDV